MWRVSMSSGWNGARRAGVAAGRERAERIAVVALAPGDDVPAPRLAGLEKILPRHLERRLDRLRTAADEIGVGEARRRVLDEAVGEPFGDFGGEEAGMGVGERVELAAQRREHVGMAMAEARHRRAAGGVEIAIAGAVDEFDAGAADGERRRDAGGSVEQMAQGFRTRLEGGVNPPSRSCAARPPAAGPSGR
jgi:hypothetical protein